MVTSRKAGVYRGWAALAMESDPPGDLHPRGPDQNALQDDPAFRAALRQRGAIVEKRGDKFVVVSPSKQPNEGSLHRK